MELTDDVLSEGLMVIDAMAGDTNPGPTTPGCSVAGLPEGAAAERVLATSSPSPNGPVLADVVGVANPPSLSLDFSH